MFLRTATKRQLHRTEEQVALTLGFYIHWRTSIAVVFIVRWRSKSDATIYIGTKTPILGQALLLARKYN